MPGRRILNHVRRLGLASWLAITSGSLLLVAAAGCSMVGLGVGGKIDSSHKRLVSVEGWDIQSIQAGTHVRVFCRDGVVAAGVFGGVESSDGEYRTRFDKWREARVEPPAVPSLDDNLTIETAGRKKWSARFKGFEFTSLTIKRDNEAPNSEVPYGKITRVADSGGVTWEGTQLARLASEGRLPLRSRLRVDKMHIPLDQIQRVEMWHKGSKARMIGFLIGAAIDVALILAIAGSHNQEPTPPVCCTSCPYAYSFDGERYRREGDIFPGAMFHAIQRSDRLVLEHLLPSGGTYRLRLTNERDEVAYLDEAKLLVIDGPEGVTVLPGPHGAFKTLAKPLAPIRASDLRGHTAFPPVPGVNGQTWISSPFAHGGEGVDGDRDGLVLEFPRQPGAKTVTLALRAEPTPWGSYLLRQVLALQGTQLPAWYATIERDATARAEFLMALQREGHLTLRLWNGARWQEAGVVVAHEAIEVPLDGTSGDTLRVRLDSTPGLWSLQSAEADYAPDLPLDVTEVVPSAGGIDQDVRDRLETADRWHLVLTRGEWVDFTFVAPALRPGRRRTLVLKTAGYYTIVVPAEGEPQQTLFAKLVREPGALGRYGRDLLRADIGQSMARLESRSSRDLD